MSNSLSYGRVFAILAFATVAALGATALFLTHPSAPASAHQTGGSGNHFLWVKAIPNGPNYAVAVQDHAGTYEYRSGQVMITDSHRNTVNITNGKCKRGKNYPFCFGDLGSPEIEYTHENDGHHLLDYDWGPLECIGPRNDLGECWLNTTSLGWLTIPIEAEGTRRIPISFEDNQEYAWVPCFCPVKTTYSPVYEVD